MKTATLAALACVCVASIPCHAQDNNPFSGAKSFEISLERAKPSHHFVVKPKKVSRHIQSQQVMRDHNAWGTGMASWYGYESGTETASGEKFNPEKMTCAMRRRDWGTILTVTVIATGISATCKLTDFGPAKRTGRIIDVSEGMAKKLGFHGQGVTKVMVE